MDVQFFKQSLSLPKPPPGLTVYLEALWEDGRGNWDRSHQMIQDIEDSTAAWIHAYLHRKEGDIWNADYWYRRANRKRPSISLEQEWEEMAAELLNQVK